MEDQKQKFAVLAVPKKSAYTLTKEQLQELENSKKSRSIEENAKTLEKINLKIKREDEITR